MQNQLTYSEDLQSWNLKADHKSPHKSVLLYSTNYPFNFSFNSVQPVQ